MGCFIVLFCGTRAGPPRMALLKSLLPHLVFNEFEGATGGVDFFGDDARQQEEYGYNGFHGWPLLNRTDNGEVVNARILPFG